MESEKSNLDGNTLIVSFCEVTYSSQQEALFYLESHNFILNPAVSAFPNDNVSLNSSFFNNGFTANICNNTQHFEHVLLENTQSDDGQRYPLEKLSILDFVDRENVENLVPEKPPSTECTPFKLVEEVKD
ncbi:hypothetical protein RJT34_12677 [Clitoria ternatea]|uniref:Uncharacterized protein n=1 Tax=Clitoria ternatea TaxID=43366 RepID=A0AAN9PLL8_CLITE